MKKITRTVKEILLTAFLVIDLFCGAGGTTTGFANTKGLVKVIACVNHDANAIKSHWLNHLDVKHFNEDIRTLDLTELIALVNSYRKLYPNAKIILWASLECTNFSKAKGGQPRDADSRTLADHLDRYIVALDPEIIMIENVVEFMSWGPLDENGKPISRSNGRDWERWRKSICAHGYIDEWKQLNSADFGAYTSRNRLFGMFAKQQQWISWPEPTHFKKPSTGNLFAAPLKWKPVREVLDFSDEGNSIFGRKKDLSAKTYERVYEGLVKFVAGGDRVFMAKYHGTGKNIVSINDPASTLSTKDRLAKIQTVWIDRNFTNGGNLNSIDQPAGALLSVPKMNLVYAEKFILNSNFNNKENSIDQPSPVITASRKHHYIVNPQWGVKGNGSVDRPCCTIIARQDKAPLHLVTVESGELAIQVFETDLPIMIKIKEFMAAYGIVDIKMRMLKISELLLIQGFPVGYELFGTQTDQKKFIGNSVHPLVPEHWIYAINDNMVRLAA